MKIFISLIAFLLLFPVAHFSAPNQELVPKYKTPQSDPKATSTITPLLTYKAEHDKNCQRWVDSLMDKLTLKEKIGQLFIYTLSPVDSKRNLVLLNDVIDTYKVGGLLFSGGKVSNQAQLTNRAQKRSRLPLMITFDGEWGLAMRLRGTPVFPKNMVLGCIQDNRLIYEYGREMARQCRTLGIQVNFAPVADVNINPHNPVINSRSFGENPIWVADKVIAYASGLESGKVLSVCKHFPGHGDTDVDSHKALPVLPFSRERLDSVELYPFKAAIRSGISGIMVGHLQVPVIEPVGGLPSSLSRNIVFDLLTKEFKFKGLIFTDALAMKGVSGNHSVCLQALKAGNDMVLAPRNLKAELAAVMEAVEKGELSREDIDIKCRKVLTYKYVLGLNKKPYVQMSGLGYRINTPQTRDLIRRLNMAAITVLNNKNHILPLHSEKTQSLAFLEVDSENELSPFAQQIEKYVPITRFRLRPNLSETDAKLLKDSLSHFKRVIVAVGEQRLASYQSFFANIAPNAAVYVFFTPGKMLMQIHRAVSKAHAVILGHTLNDEVQRQVADVLFAKATADGRLSASLGGLFYAGQGVTITPQTPLHYMPEDYGLSSNALLKADSVALDGISQGAYPGCQLVVLKDGHMVVDKTFGTHSGIGSPLVQGSDIYDLASLSKTTGTLLAIMKLYDKGRFNLTDCISDYLPFLKHSNKKNITIQELLFHQSGLPSGIGFYQEAIDKDSFKGKLFSNKKDRLHTLHVDDGFWANPNFKFKKEYVSPFKTDGYIWQVSDSIWVNQSFEKVLQKKIAEAPLGPRKYRYSDVGFILLRFLAEKLSGMPMDEYLQREFYEPMGLAHTAYLPLRRFKKSEIVPSSVDDFLRKSVLQGFVHDESAAFQGGVSGNAGLFSNARDVAQVYQMLLNGGEIDGQRYLSKETCDLFTTEVSKISRRGLGFDKPDKNPHNSNCAANVPMEVFGHTGFTGTCAWADPVNNLVYVFLSNRIYPDVNNRKLIKLNIRERIQEAVYDAMIQRQ